MDVFTITGQQYDSNIYVILGKKPTIIDTGTGIYNKYVLSTLEKYIEPSNIEQIILTHEHFDHVGGTPHLLEATDTNAKILAHSKAVPTLQRGKSDFASMIGGTCSPISVDQEIQEGDSLQVGDDEVTVLYTPGHSKGSICLYNQKSLQLFCGDTIFAHGEFGRFDLPGGDLQEIQQSIARLASLDIQAFYPGHGPIVEEGAMRQLASSLHYVNSF